MVSLWRRSILVSFPVGLPGTSHDVRDLWNEDQRYRLDNLNFTRSVPTSTSEGDSLDDPRSLMVPGRT